MAREALSLDGLLRRYLIALLAAAAVGIVAGFASAPFLASGRNPALLVGEAAGLVVLLVAALVTAARADRPTLLRMAQIGLWSAFAAAAVPGLAWFVLWLSDGSRQSLFGIAAVVVGGFPLLVSYEWPRATAAAVTCCLAGPIIFLVWWERLLLLLPFALAVATCWVVVLTLLACAARRRSKTVVPSN